MLNENCFADRMNFAKILSTILIKEPIPCFFRYQFDFCVVTLRSFLNTRVVYTLGGNQVSSLPWMCSERQSQREKTWVTRDAIKLYLIGIIQWALWMWVVPHLNSNWNDCTFHYEDNDQFVPSPQIMYVWKTQLKGKQDYLQNTELKRACLIGSVE